MGGHQLRAVYQGHQDRSYAPSAPMLLPRRFGT